MDNSKYTAITNIASLDINHSTARKAFRAFVQKKIILSGNFEDTIWHMNDERTHCSIDFEIDEPAFQNNYAFLGFTPEQMVYYLKVYVLFRLGELITTTLQSIVREIRYIIQEPESAATGYTSHGMLQQLNRVNEFFTLLPYSENTDMQPVTEFCDSLGETAEMNSCNNSAQRKLASFDSYMKFDAILKNFWADAAEDEKLFYFPVYLWWNLAGILPLRPMEFVLTPRDCVEEHEGEYFIKVRRTRLKGRKAGVTYKVGTDYEIDSYSLRADIAREILWYIQETDAYSGNELKTLFCADTHYTKWEHCRPYTSRYFTYINLCTCLRYFYTQIIQDRLGYSIIHERNRSYLNSNEINYLLLGDVRHLAMINMISQGATPVVAMALAGHSDINMSAHYYANITQFIECQVYRQYKALQSGQDNYDISRHGVQLQVGEFTDLGNCERCYSPRVREHSFEDCKKAAGPNGELGYCQSCVYHYSDKIGLINKKDLIQSRIKAECNALEDMVRRVRKHQNEPEDIMQVLMNLKSAEYSYQAYLESTMTDEKR